MMNRRKTRTVSIGKVKIGSGAAVSIQSMAKTDTANVNASVKQIKTLEEAEGRVVITNVVAGEPLLQGKLAEIGSLEGLSTLIAPGRRAFAIRVKDDTGVAGFLLPGSRVDVHATLEAEEKKERGSRDQDGSPRTKPKKTMITQTILQDIEVLAAGGEKEAGRKKSRINASVVTLSLTPGESDRLAFAASTGTLWLSLRNPRDRGQTTPGIISYDDLLNRKVETIPEEPEEDTASEVTEQEQKAPAYIVEIIHGGKKSRVEF